MPAKRKAALMDFFSTVSTGGVIGIFLANGPTGVGSSNQSGDYPARIAIKTPKAKRGFRDRRLQTDVGLATRLTTMENKA